MCHSIHAFSCFYVSTVLRNGLMIKYTITFFGREFIYNHVFNLSLPFRRLSELAVNLWILCRFRLKLSSILITSLLSQLSLYSFVSFILFIFRHTVLWYIKTITECQVTQTFQRHSLTFLIVLETEFRAYSIIIKYLLTQDNLKVAFIF